VPDDFGDFEGGYAPCPCCVVDAGSTFVAWDNPPDWPEEGEL
jgi:hypothetical protein